MKPSSKPVNDVVREFFDLLTIRLTEYIARAVDSSNKQGHKK